MGLAYWTINHAAVELFSKKFNYAPRAMCALFCDEGSVKFARLMEIIKMPVNYVEFSF